MTALLAKADTLPRTPGCYLFKGPSGEVLYVGKAIDLRARVRQYLLGHDDRQMVPYLVQAAVDLDVIVTTSEKEALLLEDTLIKQYAPRFNTKLRDDTGFLHLRLDVRKPWPRFTVVRALRADGAEYFGPYASASRARSTLEQLARAFPLRTCTDAELKSRRRPCLLHQMHRCVAPCVDLASAEDYARVVEESRLFLKGRDQALTERLTARMRAAAEDERFEEAARLRDTLRALQTTLEQQHVVDARLGDRDVWGLFREGERGAAAVFPVREGKLGRPRTALFAHEPGTDAELLSSLLNASYRPGDYVPAEILVPALPHDADALGELLSERRGRKVELRVPQRGEKARVLTIAQENARVAFTQGMDAQVRREEALRELAELLDLPGPPHRIECFDNSNLAGKAPVAAMSVFLDGQPARAEYRRYQVKTVVGADDYASMREIVWRRLKRGAREGNLPDLLVVDGGKGQLKSALLARAELGMDYPPIIGISKPRTEHGRGERDATDKLVLPGRAEPLRLPERHAGLRMLQHLRDEVHDHAIRYHRQVRGRDAMTSVLDGIAGVGATRRRTLLRELGSARAVAEADVATLSAVPGIGPSLAATIYGAFREAG